MKHLWWLVIGLVFAGCTPVPSEQAHQLLSPGRPSLLTIRSEMQMSGLSGSTSSFGSAAPGAPTIVEHDESLSSSRCWQVMELPLQVFPAEEPGHLRAELTIQRAAGGYDFRDEEHGSSSESFDTAVEAVPTSPSDSDSLKALADMKALRFEATVDRAGGLTNVSVRSAQSGDMRESLVKEVGEGAGPEEIEQLEAALRMRAMGVFSGLEDVLVYLPPDDVVVGSTWSVRRERVYPYRGFEFYMMTSGSPYSTERSTCRVTAVEQSPTGRSVTVLITGRRVPKSLAGYRRIDYLDIRGMLRVNVDTWESAEFYMASNAHWSDPAEMPMDVRFTERVTLSPAAP